ncbi:hemagglutinin repeat-containing protein [Xanthomonas oryzae]
MSIDAGRIEHLGGSISGNQVGLRSASDIRIEGASVTAVDALSVQAVGDVTVASTVDTARPSSIRHRRHRQRCAVGDGRRRRHRADP